MDTNSSIERERFFNALQACLDDSHFVRLVLSAPRPADADLQRVTVRRLALKGGDRLSFLYHHATRDVTRNETLPEGMAVLRTLAGGAFSVAHLFTTTRELQLRLSRKGRYSLHRARIETQEAPPDDTHDRPKARMLDLRAPFLADLGVADAQGRLVPAMARKWKQINKFVEIAAHALEAAGIGPGDPVNVVDFGAGKGYLTFALHDHLRRQAAGPARALEVIGVELREDLVRLCNDAARRHGLAGLRFEHGDVGDFVPGRLDVMIALHACDTATDHALHVGIRANAAIIVCSPCCHKELRPQLVSPDPLAPMLRHGIHLGQQAEMVTDSLRALWLQAHGYDAQVFEFVALEHTQKNKMILAVRRPGLSEKSKQAALERGLAQIESLKAFYGVRTHCLETLLRGDADHAPA